MFWNMPKSGRRFQDRVPGHHMTSISSHRQPRPAHRIARCTPRQPSQSAPLPVPLAPCRAISGCGAPGVRQRCVAACAALAVQARGDDDDLVRLGELLHLKEPLSDGLRLASYHPAVVVTAGAELLRAGEVAHLLGPQRLTYPAVDVLDVTRLGRR